MCLDKEQKDTEAKSTKIKHKKLAQSKEAPFFLKRTMPLKHIKLLRTVIFSPKQSQYNEYTTFDF